MILLSEEITGDRDQLLTYWFMLKVHELRCQLTHGDHKALIVNILCKYAMLPVGATLLRHEV